MGFWRQEYWSGLPFPFSSGPHCVRMWEVGSIKLQLKNLVREGNGSPLQYSCLESPMDGGAWWAAVHGVAKSQTRLSDFTFTHWRRKRQPSPVFLSGESSAGGAWWAAVYGITQSRTRLKWLSSNSSKESGNSPYLPHQKQTNKQKQWYTISHFVHLWNKDNSSVSFMAVTKKKKAPIKGLVGH